jgi:hypothetical protein
LAALANRDNWLNPAFPVLTVLRHFQEGVDSLDQVAFELGRCIFKL